MAGRLTARKVETAKPGKHSDGGNLYLIVAPTGARKWVLRFTWRGRAKEMGLGRVGAVSLADARRGAEDARRVLAQGQNPIEQRKRAGGVPTFGEMADQMVGSLSAGWRNAKHKAQWKTTLATYAAPLRPKPVDTVATEDVLGVLKPFWTEKPETASRVRGRIEKVLDAAKAKGFRQGENPARWKGHLDQLLPKRSKLRKVRHHPALPYPEMPSFWADLRSRDGMAALALQFTILTCARTNEVIGAEPKEIDPDAKIWTVPEGRMKGEREHTVPLSLAAREILRRAEQVRAPEQKLLFPLSNMAMLALLDRMGPYKDAKGAPITVHGFRSTFQDWAGDRTSFPRDLIEFAIAHKLKDETEAAYRRSSALEKRRKLMEAWARYCESAKSSNVIPLHKAG